MKLTLELTPAQLYFLDMALAEQEEFVAESSMVILGQPVADLLLDLMNKVDALIRNDLYSDW